MRSYLHSLRMKLTFSITLRVLSCIWPFIPSRLYLVFYPFLSTPTSRIKALALSVVAHLYLCIYPSIHFPIFSSHPPLPPFAEMDTLCSCTWSGQSPPPCTPPLSHTNMSLYVLLHARHSVCTCAGTSATSPSPACSASTEPSPRLASSARVTAPTPALTPLGLSSSRRTRRPPPPWPACRERPSQPSPWSLSTPTPPAAAMEIGIGPGEDAETVDAGTTKVTMLRSWKRPPVLSLTTRCLLPEKSKEHSLPHIGLHSHTFTLFKDHTHLKYFTHYFNTHTR